MIIIPLEPRHIDAMAELEKRCFSMPWSRASITSELYNPLACYFAAEENDRLIGYAGMQMVLDEGYITNVATAPESRKKGVGTALVDMLLLCARNAKLSFVTLEVRVSNLAAQKLYTNVGFEIAGKRKDYYSKPKEDAYIMTKHL